MTWRARRSQSPTAGAGFAEDVHGWPTGTPRRSSLKRPLLDVALRTTFRQVSERPPREFVVATTIARGVTAMMNFLIEPAADGASELTTETRVFAETPAAARSFGAYWHTIYPGSWLIRVTWLRAIKARAERG